MKESTIDIKRGLWKTIMEARDRIVERIVNERILEQSQNPLTNTSFGFATPKEYTAHEQKRNAFAKKVREIFPKSDLVIIELSLFANICRRLGYFLFTGIERDGSASYDPKNLYRISPRAKRFTDGTGEWIIYFLNVLLAWGLSILLSPGLREIKAGNGTLERYYVGAFFLSMVFGILFSLFETITYDWKVKEKDLTFIDRIFHPRSYLLAVLEKRGVKELLARYPVKDVMSRVDLLRLFWPDHEADNDGKEGKKHTIVSFAEPPDDFKEKLETIKKKDYFFQKKRYQQNYLGYGVFAHADGISIGGLKAALQDHPGLFLTDGLFVAIIGTFGEHSEDSIDTQIVENELENFPFEKFIQTAADQS
jgi:hypothetical protein